jgi:hypothetical protein
MRSTWTARIANPQGPAEIAPEIHAFRVYQVFTRQGYWWLQEQSMRANRHRSRERTATPWTLEPYWIGHGQPPVRRRYGNAATASARSPRATSPIPWLFNGPWTTWAFHRPPGVTCPGGCVESSAPIRPRELLVLGGRTGTRDSMPSPWPRPCRGSTEWKGPPIRPRGMPDRGPMGGTRRERNRPGGLRGETSDRPGPNTTGTWLRAKQGTRRAAFTKTILAALVVGGVAAGYVRYCMSFACRGVSRPPCRKVAGRSYWALEPYPRGGRRGVRSISDRLRPRASS